jgi:CHAT domain-containing protein/tetratricopeptide (TPR) repeat protein
LCGAAREAPAQRGETSRVDRLRVDTPRVDSRRAEARRLWLAALDQKAEFRVDSTLALLRAAIRADSSYFLAYQLYMQEMSEVHRFGQLRREFPKPPPSASVLAHCTAAFAGHDAGPLLRRIDSLPDPTGCRDLARALTGQNRSPGQSLTAVREALSREPDSDASLWMAYATMLNSFEKRDEAEAALLEGIRRSPHPLGALVLQLQLVRQRELMGDSVAAGRLRIAIGASVARDGRPRLRWGYVDDLANAAREVGDMARYNTLKREQVDIAHRSGAVAAEFRNLYDLGTSALENDNDPKAAIAPLTRSIALAGNTAAPYDIVMACLKRGRAFVKLGEFRRAELDMRRALSATESEDVYSLAEIHHNLAHLYEAQGRWSDAVREADLYSRYAAAVSEVWSGSDMHMMSLHDGGMIRWKAGWHAAARESFAEMVRDIERRNASYGYAGEYYERIGDFSRALGYYRRGAAQNSVTDRPLNLSGLTRMFEALGMRDSARAAAALHDQPGYSHGTPRLLPAILLAEGRVDEALRLARKDVDEQAAKKSSSGTASATLQLARLLLDAGRPREAAMEAANAERLAAATLTDETIEALLVQGQAQLRARGPESITTLLRARTLVRAHPTATAALNVESALGDAYAAFGRPADALIAYDRAATSSQRVTATYDEALNRARFRDERVTTFNGALRVLLGMPESRSRSEQLFSWSARKKDAVLSHADTGGAAPPAGASLSNVERTVDGGTAVVDYIAVDSGIFALVVTARESRVLRLPLSVAATSDLVQRLRRPLVAVDAGQLDLARAPFDLGLAHQLYVGLFAPIESLLGGVQRVVIVPDGPLYGVPFNALPRAPPGSRIAPNAYHAADYLIDRFNITLATSPALAGVKKSRGVAAGARVLVVRGPVAGGEREVASIVAAWPAGHAASLGGASASEAALRSQAAGRSVIHFAVHARADESDRLASYLELARDSTDDGFLHVSEVAALKFRGDLVVLTGCETMPGRIFAGTGPFGIANSFIAAGARNVIATHWPVGESAAELGRDLHRALAGGAEASDALRAAQLRLRRDPAKAHPFYWGGYVLVEGAGR